ncbi:MAG: hypothetical protein LW817_06560 [Candidatus Caenarcaniphilales bacterium]|jgi:hypothetical protein|nr:hypothetical protein [Candidatus Caenarcaniphilales bacterium]
MIYRILVVFCLLAPLQANASIDRTKFEAIYRDAFNRLVSLDLFASNAEDQMASEIRQKILLQMSEDKLEDPAAIDAQWQAFIKTNFTSLQEFNTKIENSYLKIDQVKHKFLDNLEIIRFFNTVLKPRIQKDYNLREKLLTLSLNPDFMIDATELKEARLQVIEDFGGELQHKAFMVKHNLTIEEMDFLINSNILKSKLLKKIINKDIEANEPYGQKVIERINNYFNNFNNLKEDEYHFKVAMIDKIVQDADLKLWDAHNYFEQQKKMTVDFHIVPEINVYQMAIPMTLSSNQYRHLVKSALIDLSKETKYYKLSDILDLGDQLALLELYAVKPRRTLNYSQAYQEIFSGLYDKNDQELEAIVEKYFQRESIESLNTQVQNSVEPKI